jgi:transaldolase
MSSSRLHQLSALGQSIWIDYLSRDLIGTGALASAVDEDAVVGVTSNPSIFQKALVHGHAIFDNRMPRLSGIDAALQRRKLQPALRSNSAVRE